MGSGLAAARRPGMTSAEPSVRTTALCVLPGVAGEGAMDSVGLFFASSGRVGKQDFALAAMGLYAAVIASQMLTLQWVVMRIGVWPFAIAQASLLWLWFALHANRLRDAGRSPAPAVGVAVID